MPSQLNPRIHAKKSGHQRRTRNMAAVSTWLYLTSATTSALAPAARVAFLRSPTLRTPIAGAASTGRPLRCLSTRNRMSVFAAATATGSGTEESYDIINQKNGLDKYDPATFEPDIYKWWEKSGCFRPDSKQKQSLEGRKPYVLPMPPPNVTGRLHMGHAIFVALQDVLARFHRMRGRPVLWLPGTFQNIANNSFVFVRGLFFLNTSV